MKIIRPLEVKDNERYLNDLLDQHAASMTSFKHYKEGCSYGMFAENEYIGGITARRNDQELHIALLAIKAEYRGQGVGETLLRQCEDYAAAKACTTITVTTQDYQAPSFYLKHGYCIFAKLKDVPFAGTQRFYLYKKL